MLQSWLGKASYACYYTIRYLLCYINRVLAHYAVYIHWQCQAACSRYGCMSIVDPVAAMFTQTRPISLPALTTQQTVCSLWVILFWPPPWHCIVARHDCAVILYLLYGGMFLHGSKQLTKARLRFGTWAKSTSERSAILQFIHSATSSGT